MKDKSAVFLFIAVPFMGRIVAHFPGFSPNSSLPNTCGLEPSDCESVGVETYNCISLRIGDFTE